jgi:hypothetical protein
MLPCQNDDMLGTIARAPVTPPQSHGLYQIRELRVAEVCD